MASILGMNAGDRPRVRDPAAWWAHLPLRAITVEKDVWCIALAFGMAQFDLKI